MSKTTQQAKVVHLPGTKVLEPLTGRPLLIRCKDCGYTDQFVIRIYAPVMGIAKLTDDGVYTVTNLKYAQDGTCQEEVLACGRCLSRNVEVIKREERGRKEGRGNGSRKD